MALKSLSWLFVIVAYIAMTVKESRGVASKPILGHSPTPTGISLTVITKIGLCECYWIIIAIDIISSYLTYMNYMHVVGFTLAGWKEN